MRPTLLALVLAGCATSPDAVEAWSTGSADWNPTTAPDQAPPPASFTLEATPVVANGLLSFQITGAPPGETIRVGYSTQGIAPGPCPVFLQGNCFDLAPPVAPTPVQGTANANGDLVLSLAVPAAVPGPSLGFQAISLPSGERSNVWATQPLPAGSSTAIHVDHDGDGYTTAMGDCSEADPAIHPGALEVPYDGLDFDCDGFDGTDADGDGVPAMGTLGNDCDDSDPTISPLAPESCNGLDNDCDGVPDSDANGSVCAPTNTYTETFRYYDDPIDVLLVVDRSPSMAAELADLHTHAADFLDRFVSHGTAARFGVISMDMVDPDRSGKLQSYNGRLWVDRQLNDTATILSFLEAAFAEPATEDATSNGFEAGYAALTPPLIDAENDGFRRNHASVAVLPMTDSPDGSVVPSDYTSWSTPYNDLVAAPADMTVHSFHDTYTDCGTGMGIPADWANPLYGAISGTGGTTHDICVYWNNDFASSFASVASSIATNSGLPFNPPLAFQLTHPVVPGTLTAGLLQSSGQVTPIPLVEGKHWVYNAANQTVDYLGNLGSGSHVVFTYEIP